MPRTSADRAPSRRGRKIIAITSAAAVAGVVGTLSLAAWTDNEWIFGGSGSDDGGIGTSTFEVEQQAYSADGTGAEGWVQQEDNPGNEVTFSVTDLSPGVPSYALVGLRTTDASIAGDLTLQPAVAAAGLENSSALFDAADVRVATWSETEVAPAQGCDATTFSGDSTIADGALGSAGGSTAQSLDASGGSVQYYCFELTFEVPNGADPEDYMGLALTPAWQFSATSN